MAEVGVISEQHQGSPPPHTHTHEKRSKKKKKKIDSNLELVHDFVNIKLKYIVVVIRGFHIMTFIWEILKGFI